ncbi:MAG: phosphonate C-P lyase system protein PhnH [Burkholderiaceae bacterium]
MSTHAALDDGIDLSRVLAGFASPIDDAQRAFRATLEAMSYPGRVVRPLAADPQWPEELPAAAVAVLLALCDEHTPLWFGPRWRKQAAIIDSLRFHTGAPVTEDPSLAAFAVHDGIGDPSPERFALGDDLDPQRGATLIVAVVALDRGTRLRLSGPGLREAREIAVTGPEPRFWQARCAIEPLFPRGLDLLLTAGASLVAIPRTTRVEVL